MSLVKFNNPLTLEIGAGITASLNQEQLDTVQMDGSDNTNLVLSIGQEVSTDADTTFNAVSGFPSMSIGGPGGIVIGDHLLSGSGEIGGDLNIRDNCSAQNILVKTNLIAENFFFGEESSSRIEESGSTKFGNDSSDIQNFMLV